MLKKHLNQLIDNRQNLKFLFPFCGKTVDMAWLASQGYSVVGIEFVKTACEEFFSEQKIEYSVEKVDDYNLFRVS
jgi:hypothetical protein